MNKNIQKILKYRVTYLEMDNRPNFDWPKNLKHKLSILLAESFPAWYFLFFYKQVGKNYYWTDWLRKSEDEIDEFVNDKNVLLYTLIKDGWPVGFYMLDYRKKDICDLSFFGLVDEVIGIGLGKYLLQTAILTAWDNREIKKLTVNTCSLDHKSAIYLYQKYGFTPVKYKDLEKTV